MMRWFVSGLVGLVVGGALHAQSVPAPATFPSPPATQDTGQTTASGAGKVFRLSTKLVVLDVVVTDREGKLVNGLTRDDFSIFEDRQLESIRSFDPPSTHRQPPGVVVQSAADPEEDWKCARDYPCA